MIAVKNKLIVKVRKQYNDSMGQFYVDPMFRRTENLIYNGTIVAVPEGTIRNDIPEEDGSYKEITPIAQVGDEVYFRFIANDDGDHLVYKDISDTSEEYMIAVQYSWAFAVVRSGRIIPMSGWILGEPVIEGMGDEIEIEGENGKPKKVKVKYFEGTNIIQEMHEKQAKDRCVVRYISEFKDHATSLQVGDLVLGNESHLPFENEINGEKFYCFREEYVHGVLK